jgi:long-subunit acyl-CoA synthetase (AMP-forming)
VVLSEAAKYIPREDIKASLQTTLDKVNAGLESHERMSNIVIVNDEWTIENDLLTPTLKLKRNILEDKYSQLISRQFSEPIAWES